jgi:DNA-binding transcriptional MocR family regulator
MWTGTEYHKEGTIMKYEDIIFNLKSMMNDRKIKPGGKLPSIRNLCQQFNCSKTTVLKAYDFLEKEHFLYSVPKSGYFLIESPFNTPGKASVPCIDFTSAAPDERILPYEEFRHCCNQAMKFYKKDLYSNAYLRGLENLISVIAKQLQDYQVFTNPNYLFITSGAQQAINILTMMPFPNGGENVLVEQPTYHGILKSLEMNRVKALGIKRNENGIDFNRLENLFKNGNVKYFYTIPRFHNPTGFSYSNHAKKQILKLAEKYNIYIVEDDYLGDLEMDGKADPVYAFDCDSRVIYLKSYSKVVLPGLRIAAVVLPDGLTKPFENFKQWSDLNTSILSQGALEIYIKSGMYKAHMKILRRIYADRMRFLDEITRDTSSNTQWHIPDSGFFASFETGNTPCSDLLINQLRSKNILIENCRKYFLKDFLNENLVRLSVSRTNEPEIKAGVTEILIAESTNMRHLEN